MTANKVGRGARSEIVFVNTRKSSLGAGPGLHSEIMRHLDRSRFGVVAVCSERHPGTASPMLALVRTIDEDLEIIEADFGPDSFGAGLRGSWRDRWRTFSGALRAASSTIGLGVRIRRRRPAIVYTDERPRDAAVSVVLARVAGARSIIHMHMGYGDWMSPLLKWALRRADAIFAVSEWVKASLIASGHEASRIHVVFNAIDPSPWSPGLDRVAVRRELGMAEDALTLVTVCRLLPGKGTDILLSALPRVRQNFPDVQLMVVGEEQRPGYARHLRQIATDGGVLDCVRFTGWRSDVPRLVGAADLFILPSVGEAFGLAFLEAMASGLAVIGVRSGGVPEFVEDGVAGLIVEPNDVEALASAIDTLLGDDRRRAAMGAAGRQLVTESFTSARLARDVEDCFATVMGESDSAVQVDGPTAADGRS